LAESIHGDVASFVADALTPDADAAFAEHLAECETCRDEIVWMSRLSTALGEAEFEPPAPIDLGSVRRRRRTVGLLAAVAVLLLALGGAAGFVVGRSTVPDAAQVLFDTGAVHSAVDTATRVRAEVAVVGSNGGVEVGLHLVDPVGPKQCQLVAVGKNGEQQVAMTWSVPSTGFGDAAAPLSARGQVGFHPDQISRFEIRSGGRTLLAIPA
jgi:hypothetical protein